MSFSVSIPFLPSSDAAALPTGSVMTIFSSKGRLVVTTKAAAVLGEVVVVVVTTRPLLMLKDQKNCMPCLHSITLKSNKKPHN